MKNKLPLFIVRSELLGRDLCYPDRQL